MSDLFAITAIGLSAAQDRFSTLSANAASASIPGYKRHVSAQQATFAGHLTAPDVSMAKDASPVLRGVDLRPAALVATGRPMDLAIEGSDGLFALSDGVNAVLTRNGAFRVDAEGYLVGERGLRVQGTQGDLRVGTGDLSVLTNGNIMRGTDVVGSLQLFMPGPTSTVSPGSGALINVDGPVQPVENGKSRISAGFLEASNAGGPEDMLHLMGLTRQFESLVRVTQGYDEVLGRAIQKLGEL